MAKPPRDQIEQHVAITLKLESCATDHLLVNGP